MPTVARTLGAARRGIGAVVTLVVAGCLLGGASVLALQQSPADAARVRVVHGVADAGPLDVYVDGSIALIGMEFPEISGDVLLSAGEHAFAVVPTGANPDAAIAAGTIALEGQARAYAALLGTVSATSVGLFQVDERPLDAGRARFRVISGVPDAGEIVPAFAGGEAISQPLAFGDASEYAAVDAGTYDLDLLDGVSGASLLALPQTALAEAATTEIILVGQVSDGTLLALVETTGVEVARAIGQSAQIMTGTCSSPGDLVAELGLVQPGQGEAVGSAETLAVAQGFGLAGIPFATLIASPHAVIVAEDGGAPLEFIACGDVGGRLTDTGALVIALTDDGTGDAGGVTVLASSVEDPEATGVSVFLTFRAVESSPATPAAINP
jgi:hypothetical protein